MTSQMQMQLENMRKQIEQALAALQIEKRDLASMENLVRKERRVLKPIIRREITEEAEFRGRERELYNDKRNVLRDLELQRWTEGDIISAIDQTRKIHSKMEAEYKSLLSNIEKLLTLCANDQIKANKISEARALFESNAKILAELREQLGIDASKEEKISGKIKDEEALALKALRDLETAQKDIKNAEKVIHLK